MIAALRRSAADGRDTAPSSRRGRFEPPHQNREVVGQALVALAGVPGDRVHERGVSRAASASMIAACSWQISSRSGMPRPRVRRAMRAS